MIRRLLLLGALFAAVAVLWVRSCSGPDPVVAEMRLIEPRAEATPYRIEATIRNRGMGQGDAQVVFRLRDATTGRTVQREERVALEKDEEVLAIGEIAAPRAAYTPAVEANYPPR